MSLITNKKKDKKPKSVAQLTAYDANDKAVLNIELPLEDYYEQLHEVIDSSEFRKERDIVRVTGRLYNSKGKLIQEFENKYSAKGKYLHSKITFEDGTVVED